MSSIVYRDYRDSDVDDIVRMWKESISGWPPGFFGASAITASSVAREEKNSGRLFTALAFDGDRVVGYCRTSPYAGESDASYVDLINVVTDMHGRGIGKALLLDAVARSVEHGMKRIDLHTWPANMKAVPLYKKTGFFWVPDTNVYMQNYIPYLLGRKEFLDFLGGEDWYRCFKRELLVEQDRQKTVSEREVFTYEFEKDGDKYVAEFDKRARRISRMEYPGFSAGLSVDSGKEYFVGRTYKVLLSGSGFDMEKATMECDDSMDCEKTGDDSFSMKPEAVRVGKTPYQPQDSMRVRVDESDLELSLGITGIEEVEMHSRCVRFLPVGVEGLELELKKMGDVSSFLLSYSLDGGETLLKEVVLSEDIYQSCTLEFACLESGVHTLSLKLGENGYPEDVVLIVGMHFGNPVVVDTRKAAVIAGSHKALSIMRMGGYTLLLGPEDGGRTRKLGNCNIGAGPPLWHSDLPKQVYDLELGANSVIGRTTWPSRPGLTHWFESKLSPGGFVEIFGGVDNGSDAPKKVVFIGGNRFSSDYEHKSDLLPLKDGLMVEPRVHNQVPDWEEDLTDSVSGLAAPWNGVTGQGMSIMNYYPNWTGFEYDWPLTAEVEAAPGETVTSPVFRMLHCDGGVRNLLQKAENLGWEVGDWKRRVSFFQHNLQAVMASGSNVTLSHPLHGERDAALSCGSKEIATGKIKQDVSISGEITGDGIVDIDLAIAKRSMVYPVFLVNGGKTVDTGRDDDGYMFLSNDRIKAMIDPGACGHVYSLELDATECLLAAHPEPSEFCWDKPWFGGLIPRLGDSRNNAYLLQDQMPEIEEYQRDASGLTEKGWKMTWKVDHKNWGSLVFEWSVGMVPGVPVLSTVVDCRATSGAYHSGEVDIRGFLKPGGSVEDSALTCQNFPRLLQKREHAGAWTDMGRWACVSGGNGFVEAYSNGDGIFYCEDYGKHGCHLSIFSNHDRARSLRMTWLFGTTDEDRALAQVFRAYH